MSTPKMDADYFIRKFSKIPAKKWCVNECEDEQGRRCARGWCGIRCGWHRTDEDIALARALDGDVNTTATINNGGDERYPQKTPRARILAALRDAKKAGR